LIGNGSVKSSEVNDITAPGASKDSYDNAFSTLDNIIENVSVPDNCIIHKLSEEAAKFPPFHF
jgi:hypothetical protein